MDAEIRHADASKEFHADHIGFEVDIDGVEPCRVEADLQVRLY